MWPWVILELWKGVFSYNFGMEHLMVRSVFDEHPCILINFHIFSVVQCVSLIFHESQSNLIIICVTTSGIRIMRSSIFKQIWYGAFNGAIFFWWEPMYVWQLSSYQFCSVCFLDFPWKLKYLDNICVSISDIRIMKRSVCKSL